MTTQRHIGKTPIDKFWLRTFVALLCVLLTTSLMNVAIFPLFDAVFSPAREISTIGNLLTCLIAGALSFFRPKLLESRIANLMALFFLLVSAVLIPLSLAYESAPLLVLGTAVAGGSRGWVIIVVGMAASRLTRTQAGTCVTAALGVNYLLATIAWVVPTLMSLILFVALPLCALALSHGDARPVFQATAVAERPLDLAVTQPNTFLPLGSQVFICLLLFRFAFGFSLRFGEVSGTPLRDFWAILAIVAIGAYMLLSHKNFPADGLVACAMLLVIAGFYCAACFPEDSARIGVTLLSAGSACFDLVSWLALLAVANRNRYGAVASFAWGHSLMCLGSILGAQMAVIANSYVIDNTEAFSLLSGIFIVGFAAYALLGLRSYSFAAVINAVQPAVVEAAGDEDVKECPTDEILPPPLELETPANVNSGTITDPESFAPAKESLCPTDPPTLTFEQRCERIADRHSLTAREREVLAMLARGRDRAYIEQNLVISRNTVKAHVKHIYVKLDIHSHQDLLDLVEQECH